MAKQKKPKSIQIRPVALRAAAIHGVFSRINTARNLMQAVNRGEKIERTMGGPGGLVVKRSPAEVSQDIAQMGKELVDMFDLLVIEASLRYVEMSKEADIRYVDDGKPMPCDWCGKTVRPMEQFVFDGKRGHDECAQREADGEADRRDGTAAKAVGPRASADARGAFGHPATDGRERNTGQAAGLVVVAGSNHSAPDTD